MARHLNLCSKIVLGRWCSALLIICLFYKHLIRVYASRSKPTWKSSWSDQGHAPPSYGLGPERYPYGSDAAPQPVPDCNQIYGLHLVLWMGILDQHQQLILRMGAKLLLLAICKWDKHRDSLSQPHSHIVMDNTPHPQQGYSETLSQAILIMGIVVVLQNQLQEVVFYLLLAACQVCPAAIKAIWLLWSISALPSGYGAHRGSAPDYANTKKSFLPKLDMVVLLLNKFITDEIIQSTAKALSTLCMILSFWHLCWGVILAFRHLEPSNEPIFLLPNDLTRHFNCVWKLSPSTCCPTF